MKVEILDLPNELLVYIFNLSKNPCIGSINKKWFKYYLNNNLFEKEALSLIHNSIDPKKELYLNIYCSKVFSKFKVSKFTKNNTVYYYSPLDKTKRALYKKTDNSRIFFSKWRETQSLKYKSIEARLKYLNLL